MNITIKKVTIEDIKELQKIGIKTFSETFSSSNTDQNMKKYLSEGFSNEKLLSEINNINSEFYFASYKSEIIGYLKINFNEAQTELKDKKSIEIERIYVLKEFYGKKIGQLLYEKALKIAKQRKSEYIWLGVWEKNTRAMKFYTKNGFVKFGEHIFKLGDDKQIDIMMKLEL